MRVKNAFRVVRVLVLALLGFGSLARSPQLAGARETHPSFRARHSIQLSTDEAPSQSSAAPDSSDSKLADFGWLEGRWRGEWGPRIAEQVWFSPKAGVMEGMFRVLEGDKTLVIEFLTLVQKPGGVTFYFRHFTPTLAPWEKSEPTILNLTNTDGKKSLFENPVDGMPKSTTWTRLDADTYLSHSSLVPETGDPQEIEITYKRQPTANSATSGGNGARQKKP